MTAADGRDRISLFSRDAAIFIFVGAALVLWPLALTGGHPFMMIDTAVYADQGDRIWSGVGQLFSFFDRAGTDAGGAGAGGAVDALRSQAAADDTIRSITYAAFVGLLLPAGAIWVLYVQAALVLAALYAVVAPALRSLSWGASLAGCALVLVASPLSTMASFLMPDILGAVVILFAIRMAMGLNALNRASRIVLVLITIAAITSHYGNIPLAVLLFGIAALMRAGRRRAVLAVGAVAGGTAFVAVALNVAIGVVGFDTVSLAPNRAPIMLARSIEDGPARWVLEADCASAEPRYALCAYWGTDIPTNVGAALWNERGMEQAPAELYVQIRAEEITLLTDAFLAYPLQQSWAFVGNAVRQFFRVGPRYARPGILVSAGDNRREVAYVEGTAFDAVRPVLGSLHAAGFGLALAGLLFIGGYRRMAMLVVAGLVLNAAIFGGLSAPVPRYQARVSWVLVALVAVGLAQRYQTWRIGTDHPAPNDPRQI